MSIYAKEHPSYLKQAIDSVLNQTLQPNEIVIVRDGPLTAELDAVLCSYADNDKRFKIVSLDRNYGLGVALNEGIINCRYNIIARMDGDDISLPTRFEEQYTYIASHPNVSVISSNILEFDETMNERLSERNVPELDREIKAYMHSRSPFNHMAVMYRKNVIQAVGGYEHRPCFEDYYLWCKVYAYGGSFYNIQVPLVRARAGRSMIHRRGGYAYVGHMISFQIKIYKLGVINLIQLVKNVIVRAIVGLTPVYVRALIYRKVLRR